MKVLGLVVFVSILSFQTCFAGESTARKITRDVEQDVEKLKNAIGALAIKGLPGKAVSGSGAIENNGGHGDLTYYWTGKASQEISKFAIYLCTSDQKNCDKESHVDISCMNVVEDRYWCNTTTWRIPRANEYDFILNSIFSSSETADVDRDRNAVYFRMDDPLLHSLPTGKIAVVREVK